MSETQKLQNFVYRHITCECGQFILNSKIHWRYGCKIFLLYFLYQLSESVNIQIILDLL